jgi:hypothetical protein
VDADLVLSPRLQLALDQRDAAFARELQQRPHVRHGPLPDVRRSAPPG